MFLTASDYEASNNLPLQLFLLSYPFLNPHKPSQTAIIRNQKANNNPSSTSKSINKLALPENSLLPSSFIIKQTKGTSYQAQRGTSCTVRTRSH